MPVKTPHPIYATDDFPRDGCKIVIDVLASGYGVKLFSPGGPSFPIETYSCRTGESLSALVNCLATGTPVPRGYRNLGVRDQPSESGSSVTS